MSYNTKNYKEQGGEKLVLAGEVIVTSSAKIVVDSKATIEGLPTFDDIPKQAKIDEQPPSSAETVEDLAQDFNNLLSKLKDAGLMDSTEP
jgi:hypothetical protein